MGQNFKLILLSKFRNKISVRKATFVVVPRGLLRDRLTKFQETRVGEIAPEMGVFRRTLTVSWKKN